MPLIQTLVSNFRVPWTIVLSPLKPLNANDFLRVDLKNTNHRHHVYMGIEITICTLPNGHRNKNMHTNHVYMGIEIRICTLPQVVLGKLSDKH